MSSWLGESKQIAVGRVVRYRTHERYEQNGWTFRADTFCFATRAPSGELGLFFFQGELPDGDSARALWLPEEYGLCGVEPGVLNPQLRNMAMVNAAVAQSDARVFREIEEETARRRQVQSEREDLASLQKKIADDLARQRAEVLDRQRAEALGSGEKEIVLDSGATAKASWKVVAAHVLPEKKRRKPVEKKRRRTA